MRWLICLIMFYFIPDSAGNLCSPYHRARCCDPEVQWNKNWSINKTIASLHWLLQGGNARYRLRAIYKTDEGCPPSVYKCTRPRTGRNLVWTKEETDTFKGCVIFIILYYNANFFNLYFWSKYLQHLINAQLLMFHTWCRVSCSGEEL